MINLEWKLSAFDDFKHKTRNKCARGITISCLGTVLLTLTTNDLHGRVTDNLRRQHMCAIKCILYPQIIFFTAQL